MNAPLTGPAGFLGTGAAELGAVRRRPVQHGEPARGSRSSRATRSSTPRGRGQRLSGSSRTRTSWPSSGRRSARASSRARACSRTRSSWRSRRRRRAGRPHTPEAAVSVIVLPERAERRESRRRRSRTTFARSSRPTTSSSSTRRTTTRCRWPNAIRSLLTPQERRRESRVGRSDGHRLLVDRRERQRTTSTSSCSRRRPRRRRRRCPSSCASRARRRSCSGRTASTRRSQYKPRHGLRLRLRGRPALRAERAGDRRASTTASRGTRRSERSGRRRYMAAWVAMTRHPASMCRRQRSSRRGRAAFVQRVEHSVDPGREHPLQRQG